ncbi:hypothetical protein, partial [Klebsiella pneumoniae]
AGRLVALSENEAPSPFGYDLICPQENRSGNGCTTMPGKKRWMC